MIRDLAILPTLDDLSCLQEYLSAVLIGSSDDLGLGGGSGGSVICDGDILQEDGSYILQEDGGYICIETGGSGCVIDSITDVSFEHPTNFSISGNDVMANVPVTVPATPTETSYPACYVQTEEIITNPDLLCGQYFRFTVPVLNTQFQAGIQRNLDNPSCVSSPPYCFFTNIVEQMPTACWYFWGQAALLGTATAFYGTSSLISLAYDSADVFEIGIRKTVIDTRVISYRVNGIERAIRSIDPAQTDNYRFAVVAGQENASGDSPGIVGVTLVTYSS